MIKVRVECAPEISVNADIEAIPEVSVVAEPDEAIEVCVEVQPDEAPEVEVDVASEPSEELEVDILAEFIPLGEYDHYKGDNTVVPTFEQQTLKTKNKVMDSDVNVEPINIKEIPNPAGGFTVIIGG